jgi:hypothetical protein
VPVETGAKGLCGPTKKEEVCVRSVAVEVSSE